MNLRLLTEEEIKEGILEILDYKPIAKISDFARKIGGGNKWVTGTNRVKTKPHPRSEGSFEQVVVNELGNVTAVNMDTRYLGIRPAVSFSEIEKDSVEVKEKFGLTFVKYGEYPQSIASNSLELDKALKEGTLKETSKYYSIPNTNKQESPYFDPFHYNPSIEYVSEEDNFIWNNDHQGLYYPPGIRRINPKKISIFDIFMLDYKEPYKHAKEYELDGKKYVKVDNTWFNVEPITWRVDKEKNIAVSETIISGGVPIRNIDEYLKENLSQEITQSGVKEETKSNVENIKLNIDHINIIIQIGFTISDDQPKTEEKSETKEVKVKVK